VLPRPRKRLCLFVCLFVVLLFDDCLLATQVTWYKEDGRKESVDVNFEEISVERF
jgi:hypothetical protein